jgi:hypothetical protein
MNSCPDYDWTYQMRSGSGVCSRNLCLLVLTRFFAGFQESKVSSLQENPK